MCHVNCQTNLFCSSHVLFLVVHLQRARWTNENSYVVRTTESPTTTGQKISSFCWEEENSGGEGEEDTRSWIENQKQELGLFAFSRWLAPAGLRSWGRVDGPDWSGTSASLVWIGFCLEGFFWVCCVVTVVRSLGTPSGHMSATTAHDKRRLLILCGCVLV